MARLTPGRRDTARSAAWRIGSSSWASLGSTVMANTTWPLRMEISEICREVDRSPSIPGPLMPLSAARTASAVRLADVIGSGIDPHWQSFRSGPAAAELGGDLAGNGQDGLAERRDPLISDAGGGSGHRQASQRLGVLVEDDAGDAQRRPTAFSSSSMA